LEKRSRFCCLCSSVLLTLVLLSPEPRATISPGCQVSQATFDADVQVMTHSSSTHLRLEGARYLELVRAARGLRCSGIALVGFDGLRYRQGGWSDDPGLFVLVPEVVRLTGAGVALATDLVLLCIILGSSVLGLWGFLLLAQTQVGRRIGVVAILLLTLMELVVGDFYIVNAAPVIASVPWILYFATRKKLAVDLASAFVLLGLIAAISSLCRAHSGTGICLFTLLIVTGFYRMRPPARLLLIGLFLAGAAVPALYFHHLYSQRDAFLDRQPGYLIPSGNGHVLWHSIYTGLGYVKNSEVPEFSDRVAANRAHQLRADVAYPSPQYEEVLKQEVLRIAEHHPSVIVENIVVKSVIVLFFVLISANVGLWAASLAPQPAWWQLAFLLPILFNALFGILVAPNPKYVTGLIAFAALWAVCSVDSAATRPVARQHLAWLIRVTRADEKVEC
jgi:hypothetical protein